MTEGAGIISRRAVALLVGFGALAFAAMSYLMIYSDELGGRTAGPSSYSVSAIGHGAFAALLEESGIPVLASRYASPGRAGSGGLLVAAEPSRAEALQELLPDSAASFADQLRGPTLVVLPKRIGLPSPTNDRWIASSQLLDPTQVDPVLQLLVPDGDVRRPASVGGLTINLLRTTPEVGNPQLMVSSRLRPIVGGDRGLLVGEVIGSDPPLWVLSDPDVIATHGIGRGDNAAFALALVDALRPSGGTVVIDETIHGFESRPSLWKAAFEPPFVLATLMALAALAVLLWAAVGRFGPPLPAVQSIVPGAATLVDTAANLLDPERHGGPILRRYADAALREVSERLHAPRRATPAERADWLDRLGRSRRVGASYRALEAEVAEAAAAPTGQADRLTAVAARLHRWKKELLDGS